MDTYKKHTDPYECPFKIISSSRNFGKCKWSKPLKYSFITVFNGFSKCNFINSYHLPQTARNFFQFVFSVPLFSIFLFQISRNWLMQSWITKNTFMITFNTCRRWVGKLVNILLKGKKLSCLNFFFLEMKVIKINWCFFLKTPKYCRMADYPVTFFCILTHFCVTL